MVIYDTGTSLVGESFRNIIAFCFITVIKFLALLCNNFNNLNNGFTLELGILKLMENVISMFSITIKLKAFSCNLNSNYVLKEKNMLCGANKI